MEPVVDRREHGLPLRRLQHGAPAAMGPAVDRREHRITGRAQGVLPAPQWSPPLIGGSTLRGGYVDCAGDLPQWSPPLIGGCTHGGARRVYGTYLGRNGARR